MRSASPPRPWPPWNTTANRSPGPPKGPFRWPTATGSNSSGPSPADEMYVGGRQPVNGAIGARRRTALRRARLYLCTADRADLADFVKAVCGAGVDIVQLRDKDLSDRALLERAAVARDAAHAAGALFVLNDRPDVAVACGADGVHVGQDDVPAAVARQIVGPDALVGLSTHAPEELAASAAE